MIKFIYFYRVYLGSDRFVLITSARQGAEGHVLKTFDEVYLKTPKQAEMILRRLPKDFPNANEYATLPKPTLESYNKNWNLQSRKGRKGWAETMIYLLIEGWMEDFSISTNRMVV